MKTKTKMTIIIVAIIALTARAGRRRGQVSAVFINVGA